MTDSIFINASRALVFLLALFTAVNALGAIVGEIKPKVGATLENTYTWDGKELKPKAGGWLNNTWTFDGKDVKPKFNATTKNTFIWNGRELKLKSGATLSNTHVWNGVGDKLSGPKEDNIRTQS